LDSALVGFTTVCSPDPLTPFWVSCIELISPSGPLDQTKENGGKQSEGIIVTPGTASDTGAGRVTGITTGLTGSFLFGRGLARSDAWRPVVRR
jgi:hypothetical protein